MTNQLSVTLITIGNSITIRHCATLILIVIVIEFKINVRVYVNPTHVHVEFDAFSFKLLLYPLHLLLV